MKIKKPNKDKLQCPNCKNYNTLTTKGQMIVLAGVASFLMGCVASVFFFLIITIPIAVILLLASPIIILVGYIKIHKGEIDVRCGKCGWSGRREDAINEAKKNEINRMF
ncbi:MAG: hypothetical protein WCO09_01435 [bacterium]